MGAIITEASGRLGGHVATKGGNGSHLRRNPVQNTNPSFTQQLVRQRIQVLSRTWASLIQAQRDSYALLVHGRESAFDAYRRLNFNNLGVNWSVSAQLFSQTVIYSFALGNKGLIIATTASNGRVLRSTDFGQTWQNITGFTAVTLLVASAYLGSGIFLVGNYSSATISRSTDFGLTWSPMYAISGLPGINTLYYLGSGIVLAGSTSTGHIARSLDYGLTWSVVYSPTGLSGIPNFFKVNDSIILAGSGNTGHLLRSIDNGITWSDLGNISSEQVLYSFCKDEFGAIYMCTSPNGRVLKSNNQALRAARRSPGEDGATLRTLGRARGPARAAGKRGLILSSQRPGKSFHRELLRHPARKAADPFPAGITDLTPHRPRLT